MAKLVNLCGHPEDAAAFEDYYANRHIPYAADPMPNVIGAEKLRVSDRRGDDPDLRGGVIRMEMVVRRVSRRCRQPATGPPDSYPDRTHTGRLRRPRTDHDADLKSRRRSPTVSAPPDVVIQVASQIRCHIFASPPVIGHRS
jgi:hypothetical protein